MQINFGAYTIKTHELDNKLYVGEKVIDGKDSLTLAFLTNPKA